MNAPTFAKLCWCGAPARFVPYDAERKAGPPVCSPEHIERPTARDSDNRAPILGPITGEPTHRDLA